MSDTPSPITHQDPSKARGPYYASRQGVRIGLIADLHYGDKPPLKLRHYRASLERLREAVTSFHEQQVDFVVQMGDLIDRAPTLDDEVQWLQTIERELKRLKPNRHYLLGNHCVDTLTKEEFMANTGARPAPYSFDHRGYHFILLDTCFTQDGQHYGRNIADWRDAVLTAEQCDWLARELAANEHPAIIFCHHRIDTDGEHALNNAAQVREMLHSYSHVHIVMQAHHHRNDHQVIGRTHYVTLAAAVDGAPEDGNAFGVLNLGSLIRESNSTSQPPNAHLHGFGRQVSLELPVVPPPHTTAP